MFLLNNLKQMSEKNVALRGVRTLTSHSPGKYPDHLDHRLYMLLTVLNSPLRGTLTLCIAICSDLLFSTSALHLSEGICTFANGIPSLNLNFLSCFTVIFNNMFLLNNLKQTSEEFYFNIRYQK